MPKLCRLSKVLQSPAPLEARDRPLVKGWAGSGNCVIATGRLLCAAQPSSCCLFLFRENEFSAQGAHPHSRLTHTTIKWCTQAGTPMVPHIRVHALHPSPSRKPSKPPARTKQTTYSLPIVEPDYEWDDMPTMRPFSLPLCLTWQITNRPRCNISCQVLYHIIGLGFTNAPVNTIPKSLLKHYKLYTDPLIDFEEYCYGIVHPVTKETITHYRKLIKDPLLKDLWIKAMSKELHRLAQGYPGVTKGINTIFYLSLADICKIPQDRTPFI